jgi:dipeptidyl aminopeptidase/acylaminoacyl peptidase
VADIPDWCISCSEDLPETDGYPGDDGVWQVQLMKEAGGTPSQERLVRMFQASPISHVSKVTTPTILILGSGDKRVPFCQGKEFYYQLLSRNVPVRALVYEEPHAITGPRHVFDAWVNISCWLNNYSN